MIDKVPSHSSPQHEIEPGPIRLGRFIERARLNRRLKQGELAALAGVNASYLSSIEAGSRNWPGTVIPKIATALGIHEAFFAYEAGVITQDPALLASEESVRPEDPRSVIVGLLPRLADGDVETVRFLVERLAERFETDQGNGENA